MINPNIHKRVRAEVLEPEKLDIDHPFYTTQYAIVQGVKLEIIYSHGDKIKQPGNRYMYLRYSITSDRYYLKPN